MTKNLSGDFLCSLCYKNGVKCEPSVNVATRVFTSGGRQCIQLRQWMSRSGCGGAASERVERITPSLCGELRAGRHLTNHNNTRANQGNRSKQKRRHNTWTSPGLWRLTRMEIREGPQTTASSSSEAARLLALPRPTLLLRAPPPKEKELNRGRREREREREER